MNYPSRLGCGTKRSFNLASIRLEAARQDVTTRYIYDASGNLLAEADEHNTITRYYIHGLGLLAMVKPSDEVYCYHFNATGSTIAMTDGGQEVVNKYAYTPFGVITNAVEAVPQPFKYVGQHGVMTEPNGLQFMRARYYDPKVGRFISEDPLGFDGGDLNLYVYVGNNPILLIDPWGLSWRSVVLGSLSAGVNTAALALTWNPTAATVTKAVGSAFSILAIGNAVYEYKTGNMTGAQMSANISSAAMDIGGAAIANKVVSALSTGISRGVGVANTSIDFAKTISSPVAQNTISTSQALNTVSGQNQQGGSLK